MRTKILSLGGMFAVAVAATLIAFSCATEPYDRHEPDPVIANSSELEDFIVAAMDAEDARKRFEAELNKIDFSKLETVIEDGRKVTRLPESVLAIDIEGKLRSVNEARSKLLTKHPRFAVFDQEESTRHFQHAMRTSAKVGDKMLRSGYGLAGPLIKTRSEQGNNGGHDSMVMQYLYNWCNQPASEFVELCIIYLIDGRFQIMVDSRNTATDCYFDLYAKPGQDKTGPWYYPDTSSPQNKVVKIVHTHTFGGSSASDVDKATKKDFPGIAFEIYYNGSFYSY